MNIFDFMIESRKTIYPSYRILIKKRFDNIDKQYNTVNRMKRVVGGLHWWWNIYLINPQYERCRWLIPKDEQLPF